MLLPTLLLLACQPGLPRHAPQPPLLLARRPDLLATLELPETNHPEGNPAPERAVVRGSWEQAWSEEGLVQYKIDLPVGQVFHGHSQRAAPQGMELLGPSGEPISYHMDRSARPELTTWRTRADTLYFRPALGEVPPDPSSLQVHYPHAAAWENALDPATAGSEGAAFALRDVDVDDQVRHGVLLPAPGLVRWDITVPPGGVLDMELRLLPPGVDRGVRSDGARVAVRVLHDGQIHELMDRVAGGERWRQRRVDLSPWAGQQVQLEIATSPGDSTVLDRVFIANPVVYTPSREPQQLVLIFVDTLRRDHVGLYGYERDTTPVLDDWAKQAVVFDDARATSSWTLPSARALLTGMPQGAWGQVPTLQQRLAEGGFTTGAFVANAFLTRHFDMGQGWGHYEYELLAPAEEQVDRALAFLEHNADRDAAVMIQLMEPHMPYAEPEAWRHRWAGEEPAGLAGKINRRGLRDLRLGSARKEEVLQYLLARYDQNIAHTDHELERLLDGLRDDAVVVFFSDHGEEFWEHGSVEHGHSLFDELLRVPLVLKAPGLEPGRVKSPVSLLDLTPTLLDLLGLPGQADLQGVSLLPAVRGEPEATEALAARPLFFGELLYDDEAWGVLSPAGLKWISRGGSQKLFDLVEDPGEQKNLSRKPTMDLTRYPPLLAAALGREVVPAWRMAGRGESRIVRDFDGRVALSYPAGILSAWHPPSLTGDMSEPTLTEAGLEIASGPGLFLPRELFMLAAGDPLEPSGLEITITSDVAEAHRAWAPVSRPLDLDRAHQRTFLNAGNGVRRFTLCLQWMPLPYPQAQPLAPQDSSIQGHLQALGYIDD
jgi:arylsulfatase A-like enzyme